MRLPDRRASRGFTLIELMIVVSIIGILAAIAIPRFAELVRKSQEGSTKGNLGALRSILSIYYADNEGLFPSCVTATNSSVFTASLLPKYADKIPISDPAKYHASKSQVFCHTHAGGLQNCTFEGYGWIYAGVTPSDPSHGSVIVSCRHTDTKGTQWRQY